MNFASEKFERFVDIFSPDASFDYTYSDISGSTIIEDNISIISDRTIDSLSFGVARMLIRGILSAARDGGYTEDPRITMKRQVDSVTMVFSRIVLDASESCYPANIPNL